MFKRQHLMIAIGLFCGAAYSQSSAVGVVNADRAASEEAVKALTSEKVNIGTLDALLSRLPEPTALRATLQLRRADQLAIANRNAAARAAVEEAVQLMPESAEVKIEAAYVLTFAGNPQRAADLWVEAAVISPDIAAKSDNYFLDGLLERLRDLNDTTRADRLDSKMGEVGVIGALASERSASALTRAKAAFKSGGAEKARPLISAIIAPVDLLGLYIDRRFATLWPTIAQWAGPDFKTAQFRFFTELRREWWSASAVRSAGNYARALNAADHPSDTVTLFLPVLKAAIGKDDSGFSMFLVPEVGTGMDRIGRGAEFDRLLAQMEAELDPDTPGLNLNVSAVLVSRAYEQENWKRAAKLADDWVAEARRIGAEVNESAIRQVAGMGACAHERLGTTSKEYNIEQMFDGTSKGNAELNFRLCTNNRVAAKKLLLEALANAETRTWALTRLQPATLRENALPRYRGYFVLMQELRRDKEILSAADRVGRILPEPLLDDLPDGFDPLRTGPLAPPSPDSI